ncbi:MAG: T9SS type A sorting domain-containing protein, partial [Bacteroidota bacterium]|nr:T9SS type A sorting domain-containing protein [Bacteroidota bacterium]
LATAAAQKAAPAALFPNPAYGTATLRLPASAPRQPLTLTDALGRVVRRYPAPAGPEAELDLRGLPAGTYVVQCGALTQRLVVE